MNDLQVWTKNKYYPHPLQQLEVVLPRIKTKHSELHCLFLCLLEFSALKKLGSYLPMFWSYESHCYLGHFIKTTPFDRHDSTPMPGNVLSDEERQSPAAWCCHYRNRKRKPEAGWERDGGRAEAVGFLNTRFNYLNAASKATTLAAENTGNETKLIPQNSCVWMVLKLQDGNSARIGANF